MQRLSVSFSFSSSFIEISVYCFLSILKLSFPSLEIFSGEIFLYVSGVVALTDIILQEASTPEVDDVIRIEDDNDRGAGRLEHEHKNPALCIVAAGRGSRLKHFSERPTSNHALA